MKKIILLLIICWAIPSFSNAYVDLDNSHLVYDDIIKLNEENIVLGYPDDTFRPDNYITEEELITIVLRGANLDVCSKFNNWPSDYLELAINNGVIADESLVTGEEFINFMNKVISLPEINDFSKNFANNFFNKKARFNDTIKLKEYITRADACKYINKILNNDGKISKKELPYETEIYYESEDKMEISTSINCVEVFEYDTYTGKYAENIDLLKTGEHPYLQARNKNAIGKYIVAVEFDTINNSEYGVWTSYKSLKFENINVIDAFDNDEINKQLANCVYDATLIKPNESYAVTAFYIVDKLPEELIINRDITTLYNLQTHKYADVNSFSKINIKL